MGSEFSEDSKLSTAPIDRAVNSAISSKFGVQRLENIAQEPPERGDCLGLPWPNNDEAGRGTYAFYGKSFQSFIFDC